MAHPPNGVAYAPESPLKPKVNADLWRGPYRFYPPSSPPDASADKRRSLLRTCPRGIVRGWWRRPGAGPSASISDKSRLRGDHGPCLDGPCTRGDDAGVPTSCREEFGLRKRPERPDNIDDVELQPLDE